MTLSQALNSAKKEILLNITYGHFKVIQSSQEDNIVRFTIEIDDKNFIIAVSEYTNMVMIHGLDVISDMFTIDERQVICRELLANHYFSKN